MSNIFFELTLILILAGGIATVISLFKQPPIIAYILTGLVIGPVGYYRLHNGEILQGLGEVGITLLLFLVGLELDLNQIKKFGLAVLVAGGGQIIFTLLLAFGILHLLGFTGSSAWLLAAALTFSSTIIVVKLLNDKRDLHSLYGKIVVGILILQDFAAIFLLVLLSSNSVVAGNDLASTPVWQSIFFNFVKALMLLWIVHWVSKYILPHIMKLIGKSDELLLVFSLAWALGLAAFVSLPFVGFNIEIGGFLAGLALGRSAVNLEISNRVKSLRDFFIIIFFIVLGAGLVLDNIYAVIIPAIVLSLFVIIVKPLLTTALLGLVGYKPRTSFLSGNSLGQVSEFGLILGALGLRHGFIDETATGILTLTAILTIAGSSYFIMRAEAIYEKWKQWLHVFDVRGGKAERGLDKTTLKKHVIIVGAHRLGKHIVEVMQRLDLPFIVVDQDPDVAEYYRKQGVIALCGDISDSHIQELAGVTKARLIISTVPHIKENEMLIKAVQKDRTKAKLIITAQDEDDALTLYGKGIDYVLLPHFIGGQHLAKMLEDDHDLRRLDRLRKQHLKSLAV